MQTKEEAASYPDIRIHSPYHVQQILQLRVEKNVNDHAKLYLTGIIDEKMGVKDVEIALSSDSIEVQVVGEHDDVYSLFHGCLTHFQVQRVRGIDYFELEGLSHSYQLDRKRTSRSFQNKTMTYVELARSILKNYPASDLIDRIFEKKRLEEFVLQYEETDWQFLKRIASRFGAVLVPESTATSPKLWFGIPEGNASKLTHRPYQLSRNMAEYDEAVTNGVQGLTETDFTRYRVMSYRPFSIGDRLLFQNQTLTVASVLAEMRDGLLTYEYELGSLLGIRQNRLENQSMIGASIEGRILDVQQDTVQIHLTIDESQKKEEAYWFPYSTMYTAEGNSGLYCMPEVGDVVQLYLSNAEEAEAVAMSSVRRSGQDSPKLSDPSVKYLGNPHGKEMKLSDKEFVITAKADQMYMNLSEDSGIEIRSDKTIQVKADGNIAAQSATKVELKAKDKLYIIGGMSSLIADQDVDIQGGKVFFLGQSKGFVPVPDIDAPPEDKVMSPSAVKEFTETMQGGMNLAQRVAASIPMIGRAGR